MQRLRWWQRPAYIAAIAGLAAAVAVGTLAANSIITGNEVNAQGEVLDRIDQLAIDNRSTLEAIEKNQAGVDELVEFVRDIQSRPEADDDTVRTFVRLLCASSDPVRQQACAELGATPP